MWFYFMCLNLICLNIIITPYIFISYMYIYRLILKKFILIKYFRPSSHISCLFSVYLFIIYTGLYFFYARYLSRNVSLVSIQGIIQYRILNYRYNIYALFENNKNIKYIFIFHLACSVRWDT